MIKDAKRDGHIKAFVVVGVLTVILMVVALYVYMSSSQKKIDSDNRMYLQDNTASIAESIDDALTSGYQNIKILSTMLSNSSTGKEVDIASIQQLVENSVFDFMEFADAEGMDHNITGGVSDAKDRKYYLDAMAGNTGMELIYHSRATHETLLMFYSPVYFKEEIVGSLVGVYQATNRITKLLTTQYYGEPATSFLCTEEGRIVASTLPLNTEIENRIEDIAGEDTQAREKIKEVLNTGSTMSFKMGENEVGVCMAQLPQSKWFVLQIFPEAASREIINSNYSLVFKLVGFLFVIYLILMISLTLFQRKQQRIVEEANSSKTTFLFNMSHDIRTPMNAITGYTALARRHIDNKEMVYDYLNKIDISSHELLALINQVLEMSRIESGKVTMEEKPVDITEKFSSMVAILKPQAEMKGLEFRTAVRNVRNRMVITDELRLGQIALNVVSNAIKYTPEGGTVELILEETDSDTKGCSNYRLTTKDTGIGMSPEFVKKIFDPFSREQSSTVSQIQGTGLGMSIVKDLVELMDGTIDIDSTQGVGTEITISLPIKHSTSDGITKEQNITEEVKTASLDGLKILLVEDNEMNREIATDILEEYGTKIDTAENGALAVEKVRNANPGDIDVVLMDIQMPVMNGYDATRAIREFNKEIPIIAMTANAFEEDRQNALASGMNEHIAKPIDIVKLKETLARFL